MRFVMAAVLAHTCTNRLRHEAGLPPGTGAADPDGSRSRDGADGGSPVPDGGDAVIGCQARDLNTQRWRAAYDPTGAFIIEHDLPAYTTDAAADDDGRGGRTLYFGGDGGGASSSSSSSSSNGRRWWWLAAETRAAVARWPAQQLRDAAAGAVTSVSGAGSAGASAGAGGGTTAAWQRLQATLRRAGANARLQAGEAAAAAASAAAATISNGGAGALGGAALGNAGRDGARGVKGLFVGGGAGRLPLGAPRRR